MKKLTELKTVTDKNESGDTWVLFKHSYQCGISANALEELEKAEESGKCPEIILIDVIASRPVSLAIAEQFKITHQSPQVIFFHMGKPVWHASHYKITAETVLNASEKMS
ncbi:MAG: bacillithiol system redox-active protein YtxJ [Bacteroidetes bacterium]|nr:bacillithiol system redox-active protein YtxJ [Bacteroidota bacterium]